MTVTIKSAEELDKMRVAGRLAADVLDMIGEHVQGGVTTGELNSICHDHIVNVQDPDDGMFVVGSRVRDNGDGTWHYEYAIQNLNHHGSGRELSIPIGNGVTITDPGFHDVDYHSGDGEVVNGVHRHLGDKLVHSCIVGATHWSAGTRDRDLPGAEPTFFFAPGQIQKRSREWGPQVLEEKLGTAWRSFRDGSQAWLRVQRGAGRSDVERVYHGVLEGRAKPDQGHVLSLHD